MIVPCLVGCTDTPEANEENQSVAEADNVEFIKLNTKTAAEEITEYPIEKAYVRDGKEWSDMNWREIIKKRGLNQNNQEPLVFKTSGGGYNRYVLFTFDISEFRNLMYENVLFKPAFTGVNASSAVTYKIYKLDPLAWDSDTVTWNTQPKKGALLAENCVAGGMTPVNLTDAVDAALLNGENEFSIMMISDKQVGDGENRLDWRATTLTATTAKDAGSYTRQLVDDPVENQAIWDWAQQVYDDWKVRYDYLVETGLPEVDLIPVDENEYTKKVLTTGSGITGAVGIDTIKWKDSDFDRWEPTRTIDSLIGLGDYTYFEEEQQFDKYGGLIDDQMRQEATGFFYSKKIGDRW